MRIIWLQVLTRERGSGWFQASPGPMALPWIGTSKSLQGPPGGSRVQQKARLAHKSGTKDNGEEPCLRRRLYSSSYYCCHCETQGECHHNRH